MTQSLTLSRRVDDLVASPIRDILSVIDRPGMVSFAGGLPSEDTFPDVGRFPVPQRQLQYGPTEGEPELRARVADDLRRRGLKCTAEQVLILSGSQQGIDLIAKLFIDPATSVAVESPTYLAALQVFKFYGACMNAFESSDQAKLRAAIKGRAFAYVIPNFQNPTGRCYSKAERETLSHVCDSTLTPLFEDDPYCDLNYDNCATDPICASLERAPWVYQGSFSKSLAPGLRLGYLACSPDLMPYFVRLKQASDLHSNRLSQWIVLQQLNDPSNPQRITKLVDHYREKRDRFGHTLSRYFSELATWVPPSGGLFFWMVLNSTQAIDTTSLLSIALERGVAFMPGESFFIDAESRPSALRLNFSHADAADVERGIAILADLVEGQIN